MRIRVVHPCIEKTDPCIEKTAHLSPTANMNREMKCTNSQISSSWVPNTYDSRIFSLILPRTGFDKRFSFWPVSSLVGLLESWDSLLFFLPSGSLRTFPSDGFRTTGRSRERGSTAAVGGRRCHGPVVRQLALPRLLHKKRIRCGGIRTPRESLLAVSDNANP